MIHDQALRLIAQAIQLHQSNAKRYAGSTEPQWIGFTDECRAIIADLEASAALLHAARSHERERVDADPDPPDTTLISAYGQADGAAAEPPPWAPRGTPAERKQIGRITLVEMRAPGDAEAEVQRRLMEQEANGKDEARL